MSNQQQRSGITELKEQLEMLQGLYDEMIREQKEYGDVKPIQKQMRELEKTISKMLNGHMQNVM